MLDSHTATLRRAILDDPNFVGATFSGRLRGATTGWTRVTVRPVMLRGERALQFVYYTEQRGVAKNYAEDHAAVHLDEILAAPFKYITARTASDLIEVRVQRSGVSHLGRHPAAPSASPPDQRHDRAKSYFITTENAHELLTALGMTTPDGDIRSVRLRKLRQINEFLKLLQQTGRLEQLVERARRPASDPIRIVDFGCGNAYLTFAIYHYLQNITGVPARVIGVDRDAESVQRNLDRAALLGWTDVTFQVGQIGDTILPDKPDIVLALHACDTATDEALARAIVWQSPLVVAVPCCHHDIQIQIERNAETSASPPLLRHSILRERLGDVLTDAFRAQLLRMMGYQTDVLQFISPEHTAKNIMVRAAWSGVSGRPRYLHEYHDLKAVWGVTPALEKLLAERGIMVERSAISNQPSALSPNPRPPYPLDHPDTSLVSC